VVAVNSVTPDKEPVGTLIVGLNVIYPPVVLPINLVKDTAKFDVCFRFDVRVNLATTEPGKNSSSIPITSLSPKMIICLVTVWFSQLG